MSLKEVNSAAAASPSVPDEQFSMQGVPLIARIQPR